METEKEYYRDLSEIRSMMERSSKFLSLSGWSGVLMGIYALAGAFFANLMMQDSGSYVLYNMTGSRITSSAAADLLSLAVIVLLIAIGTTIYLAYIKSTKNKVQFWNATTRRLMVNMMIPLFAGGFLIGIMIAKGLEGMVLSLMLLFYGLTLVNASKFTYAEIKYLGIIFIGLGLMAAAFTVYSLLLWAIGFGIMHIIYGLYIHVRYEKHSK